MCTSNLRQRQSGAVLLVSLVLLVVMTLFAFAAMNYTNTQARIAGNLQVRTELKAVAQQAIEQVISTNFVATPVPYTVATDVNGDGVNDYTVTVTPTCLSSVTISPDDASIDMITDATSNVCSISMSGSNTGIETATPGGSLCANSLWDLAATGTDASTATFKSAAAVTVHQGVANRVLVGTTC